MGSSVCERLGWACLHHPGAGGFSSIPSCPAFQSRRQGLVSVSQLLKGGFMSAPKCLILCFQYLHHTTYVCAFLWQGPRLPTREAEALPDAIWEVLCQEKRWQ